MRKTFYFTMLCLCIAGLSFTAIRAEAATVQISGWSYVKISNFSGLYNLFGHEVQCRGFDPQFVSLYHSIPTIETKLINNTNPLLPPSQQPEDNALLFDFRNGYANIGDYAAGAPTMMIGGEPWYHAEFDWATNINTTAAPYLYLELVGSSPQVIWRISPGAGPHSGHVVLDFPKIADLTIRLSVEPVPEPISIVILSLGLSWLTVRRRKKLSV